MQVKNSVAKLLMRLAHTVWGDGMEFLRCMAFGRLTFGQVLAIRCFEVQQVEKRGRC